MLSPECIEFNNSIKNLVSQYDSKVIEEWSNYYGDSIYEFSARYVHDLEDLFTDLADCKLKVGSLLTIGKKRDQIVDDYDYYYWVIESSPGPICRKLNTIFNHNEIIHLEEVTYDNNPVYRIIKVEYSK